MILNEADVKLTSYRAFNALLMAFFLANIVKIFNNFWWIESKVWSPIKLSKSYVFDKIGINYKYSMNV